MPECAPACDTNRSGAETPDAFADAVRDILRERLPNTSAEEIESVTDLIADAYIPRIKSARRRSDFAEGEMHALLDRDRAMHEVVAQARRTAQLFLDGQTRERVIRSQLDHVLREVRRLTTQAAAAGASTLDADTVAAILATGVYVPDPGGPVPIAVRPDNRYNLGVFTSQLEPAGRRFRYAFIGWSVVLRGDPTSEVEPCFLVDGVVVPRCVLESRGLKMYQLIP
jgi:hypothetical protein